MTSTTRYLIYTLISVSVFFSVSLSWIAGIHRTLLVTPEQLASISYTTGDQSRYMDFAQTGVTTAPYKYRVVALALPTLLTRSGVDVYMAFALSNALYAILSALVFSHLLERFFDAVFTESALGIMALLTSVGVIRTALFPMLDIAALFASVLVLYAILDGRLRLFIPVVLLAVGVKEVFAISGLLYLLYQENKLFTVRLLMLALPIIAFATLRLALGGAALEVNAGFDIASGELPAYGLRMLSMRGWAMLLTETLFAAGVLWFGLMASDRFVRLALLTYVLPMVIAAWLLSSRIARPLVVIVPVLIIGCIVAMRHRVTRLK